MMFGQRSPESRKSPKLNNHFLAHDRNFLKMSLKYVWNFSNYFGKSQTDKPQLSHNLLAEVIISGGFMADIGAWSFHVGLSCFYFKE